MKTYHSDLYSVPAGYRPRYTFCIIDFGKHIPPNASIPHGDCPYKQHSSFKSILPINDLGTVSLVL